MWAGPRDPAVVDAFADEVVRRGGGPVLDDSLRELAAPPVRVQTVQSLREPGDRGSTPDE